MADPTKYGIAAGDLDEDQVDDNPADAAAADTPDFAQIKEQDPDLAYRLGLNPHQEALEALNLKFNLGDGKAAVDLNPEARLEYCGQLAAIFHQGQRPRGVGLDLDEYRRPHHAGDGDDPRLDWAPPELIDPSAGTRSRGWVKPPAGAESALLEAAAAARGELEDHYADRRRIDHALHFAQIAIGDLHQNHHPLPAGDPERGINPQVTLAFETHAQNSIAAWLLRNDPFNMSSELSSIKFGANLADTVKETSDLPYSTFGRENHGFMDDPPMAAAFNLTLHHIVQHGLQDLTREPYASLNGQYNLERHDLKEHEWLSLQTKLLATVESHFANRLFEQIEAVPQDPRTRNEGLVTDQDLAEAAAARDQVSVLEPSRQVMQAVLAGIRYELHYPHGIDTHNHQVHTDQAAAFKQIAAAQASLESINDPDLRAIAETFADDFINNSRAMTDPAVREMVAAAPGIATAFPGLNQRQIADLALQEPEEFYRRIPDIAGENAAADQAAAERIAWRAAKAYGPGEEYADATAFAIVADQLETAGLVLDHIAKEAVKSQAVRDGDLAAGLGRQNPELRALLDNPELLQHPEAKAAELGQALFGLIQEKVTNSDQLQELLQRSGPSHHSTDPTEQDNRLRRILSWQAASPIADHLVKTLYGIPERVAGYEPEDDHAHYMASHFSRQLTQALSGQSSSVRQGFAPTSAEQAGEILAAAAALSSTPPPENHQERLAQLLAVTGGRSTDQTAREGMAEKAWDVACRRLDFKHVLGGEPDAPTNPMAHGEAKGAIVTGAAKYITGEIRRDSGMNHENRAIPADPAAVQERVNHWSAGLEAAAPRWEQAINRFLAQSQLDLLVEHTTELPLARDPDNYRNPELLPALDYLNERLEERSEANERWLRSDEAITMSAQQLVRNPEYQHMQLEINQIGLAIRAIYHADQAATA